MRRKAAVPVIRRRRLNDLASPALASGQGVSSRAGRYWTVDYRRLHDLAPGLRLYLHGRRHHAAIVSRQNASREASLGKALYWTATIIAALILVVVAAGYISNAGEGVPFISIAALMLAGAIWLAGWICRNLAPQSN